MPGAQKIDLIKWLNVVALVAGLGVFGYMQTAFNNIIDKRVEVALGDSLKTAQIIKASTKAAKKAAKKTLEEKTTISALATAFEGFRGMSTPALVEYMNHRFEMADSIAEQLPKIQENHKFVEGLIQHQTGLQTCGVVLYDPETKKPKYFKSCDGENKAIYYGKPRENMRNDAYYYHNATGAPIVLSYLSNIVINGL